MSVVSVCVSGVSRCQWCQCCQYVSVLSVCFSCVSLCQWCQYVSVVSVVSVGVSDVSLCHLCQYVAVVSVCFSKVRMCQWCQYTPIEILLPKIIELLVKKFFVAPDLDCRYTGMLDWLLNNFFNRV